jgi:hypothetical protein
MVTLLGQFNFTITPLPSATVTIVLSSSLVDSAGTYGPGEGTHTQEFLRLPGNVVRTLQESIIAAVEDATTTLVSMDLDLDDFGLWDNQIDQIFIQVKNGYGLGGGVGGWTLDRDIVAGVREFRFARVP